MLFWEQVFQCSGQLWCLMGNDVRFHPASEVILSVTESLNVIVKVVISHRPAELDGVYFSLAIAGCDSAVVSDSGWTNRDAQLGSDNSVSC